MKHLITATIALIAASQLANSAVLINSLDTAVVEDFESYSGAGFNDGTGGTLIAADWADEGMSDGDRGFGVVDTVGDHARGSSSGGVTTGGFYAFDTGGGNTAMGVQTSGADFTSGSLTLALQNNTGLPASSVTFSGDLWSYNDQGRSTEIIVEWGESFGTYESVSNLVSVEAASGSPEWILGTSFNLTVPASLADSDTFYLNFRTGDISGSGSRDQLAWDNISVILSDNPALAAAPEPGTTALLFGGFGLLQIVRRFKAIAIVGDTSV